ncbi:hypothetical protein CEQ90_01550 [Lewinellaceae bacterium SD302]|nr:hypothetical protein CEQ90_01550 [Lewinellaceae bacterium SD302]
MEFQRFSKFPVHDLLNTLGLSFTMIEEILLASVSDEVIIKVTAKDGLRIRRYTVTFEEVVSIIYPVV